MAELKIYCPLCGRNVGKWDGKTKSDIDVKCKKCNRLVVFYPEKRQTGTKPIPKPTTASGKRFY